MWIKAMHDALGGIEDKKEKKKITQNKEFKRTWM